MKIGPLDVQILGRALRLDRKPPLLPWWWWWMERWRWIVAAILAVIYLFLCWRDALWPAPPTF